MSPAREPDDSDQAPSLTRTVRERARDTLAGLAAGLGGLLAHGRQYLRRARGGHGPTTRQAVLRELGLSGAPESVPARVGATCDRARTDASDLPWRTSGWYGGQGGHDFWGTEAGTARRPVVFVHGNGGDACNFDSVATHLLGRGWRGDDLWAITFGSFTPDHAAMAPQLDDFVGHVRAATGAEAVDVVAHSLGVTGVRYWLASEDRYDAVARFVGLGGPNHGVCGCPGCTDASPDADGLAGAGSACADVAPECFAEPGHPLAGLNGDETPGDVEYVMVRGRLDPLYWCDRRSPYLDGARNRAVVTGHMGLLEQSAVVRRALAD